MIVSKVSWSMKWYPSPSEYRNDAGAVTHAPTLARPARLVFVCTANSARSQLAAALWARSSRIPAASAGTHPAEHVHPGAVVTAGRHQLALPDDARPRLLQEVGRADDVLVTVCDLAHEELGPRARCGRGE